MSDIVISDQAPLLQLVAGGAEEGLAQQLAGPPRGYGVRALATVGASSQRRRSLQPRPSGSKSTLSRTPQSGQAQSSGTSLHGVPAGKPSRGCPASSS